MAGCYAVGISDLAGLPSSSANWRAKRFAYACPILFETDTYAISRYQACEILQAQSENDIFEDTLLVSGVLCDVTKEETKKQGVFGVSNSTIWLQWRDLALRCS